MFRIIQLVPGRQGGELIPPSLIGMCMSGSHVMMGWRKGKIILWRALFLFQVQSDHPDQDDNLAANWGAHN